MCSTDSSDADPSRANKGTYSVTKRSTLLVALTLALGSSLGAIAAPLAPDAGQTSRELQKQPDLNGPKVVVPLRAEPEGANAAGADDKLRIAVKAILIAGNNDTVPAQALDSLVADLIGGDHSLAELDAAAERITAYYRAHDYVVARAYVPAQEVKDGVVVIRVLLGLLDHQILQNHSRLPDSVARGYLQGIKPGAALQTAPVDRTLLLLADTPGVGGARATLQPGASVGTSELVIEIDPSSAYSANAALDNYGNRYTGEYRMDLALGLNSPLQIGDQLTLRALASDLNMRYARLAYQLPLGGDGLKVGAAYADTRYQLGMDFASLLAHGSATNASVYGTYPIVRTPMSQLTSALTWEGKKLLDDTGAPVTSASKQVRLVNLGLTGIAQDSVGRGGVTALDFSLVAGKLTMDAQSLATDTASAQSNGHFTRLTYTLSRQQSVTEQDTLALVLSGQLANKNLGSSEKFSLGGASGVRAYPQGEGSGDEGWLANLELRHSWTGQLQSLVFYDLGSVSVNHRPFAATPNLRDIAGAGLGLNAQFAQVQLKAAVAWRTQGGPAQSQPATISGNPRFWVQANGQF